MKSTYACVVKMLSSHTVLSWCLITLLACVGAVGMVAGRVAILAAAVFGFSLATMIRYIAYRGGKIPFIMSDTTWDVYRVKYGDDAESVYRDMSIKRAGVYLMICVAAFLMWLIAELLCAVV